MKPTKAYDLVARSAIVCGEKPNKPLEGVLAENPNKMNRLTGYLADNRKVLIAQRPGKGGMDFTKITGGKVYAVAADGLSPVYGKDADGKPTKTQKQEDGLPLFSSSGFYCLSSKEYPALHMMGAFTKLSADGELIQLVTPAQLKAKVHITLDTDEDLADLLVKLEASMGDANNLVTQFDAHSNKKRARGIERAKSDATDASEEYDGVEFKELSVSPKDGNSIVVFAYRINGGEIKEGAIERHMVDDDSEKGLLKHVSAAEAIEFFQDSEAYLEVANALDELHAVDFSYLVGNSMRTSVSFRRKVENAAAEPATKTAYGDTVYIRGAIAGWTKALVTILHSMHPSYPANDYAAHHYVAAPRQAEVGLDKAGSGYSSPLALHYNLAAELLGAE